MAVKKSNRVRIDGMTYVQRGGGWHVEFTEDGRRYRESLDTSDWNKAQKEAKKRRDAVKEGKRSASIDDFSRLVFETATEKYLLERKLELAESSQQKERQLLVKPKKFFEGRKLRSFEAEDILNYRQWRAEAGVGATIINMEVGVVRRMLKRAKRWNALAEDVRPLRQKKSSVGRALDIEDKLRLLRVAGLSPGWENARLAMILALCTTMRGVEIKNLRWCDVDFFRRTLNLRRSKTDEGLRSIPLNEDAYQAILELRERAQKFKDGPAPEHYLFPSCEHNHIDPTRPMKSWRTAWRKLTRLIQCPVCREAQNPAEVCRNKNCGASLMEVKSPLAGLRFHDMRHHAITELAESDASDMTIMAVAGHVSRRMLEHYSHVRQEKKREAVNHLSARVTQPMTQNEGWKPIDTKIDTKPVSPDSVPSYVIENMVGTSGFEPLTSTVSR